MSMHSSDSGIPLLTEILPVPADDSPAQDGPAAVLAHPVLLLDIAAPLQTPSPTSGDASAASSALHWDEQDRESMEARISDRITRQVLRRLDFVLEQRVRDSLADVLQVAVEGLTQEIRRGLHQTLEDTIGRAVAQELSHLQKTKD
ncbi:hypothetical protein [Actimicrobium antarcticum]|uniref:Uncharacterized protein n=1 Tax=Actimicrobium antarcticum TaxID=1051899 RepID=A0ABP7THV0_9BURK